MIVDLLHDMVVTLLELRKICLGVSCLVALHFRARRCLMVLLHWTFPYSGLAHLLFLVVTSILLRGRLYPSQRVVPLP
jgi:hypothetical protein